MELKYLKTKELIPYARNSRTHSDEKYAQVIVQRYVDYTSNQTVKINGIEYNWENYKTEHAQ